MRPLDLVINPRDDPQFAADVQSAVDNGADTPRKLADRLRSAYPLITVHDRGLIGEARTVWYVYRDGRWIRGSGG